MILGRQACRSYRLLLDLLELIALRCSLATHSKYVLLAVLLAALIGVV